MGQSLGPGFPSVDGGPSGEHPPLDDDDELLPDEDDELEPLDDDDPQQAHVPAPRYVNVGSADELSSGYPDGISPPSAIREGYNIYPRAAAVEGVLEGVSVGIVLNVGDAA